MRVYSTNNVYVGINEIPKNQVTLKKKKEKKSRFCKQDQTLKQEIRQMTLEDEYLVLVE